MVRIALSTTLCVGLVAIAVIGQISGFVHDKIGIDFGAPWSDALYLEFDVGLEYTIGSWTSGTAVSLYNYGLLDISFVTIGSIGAIQVYSSYWLDGEYNQADDFLYADWDNAVWTSVAGADFWAIFSTVEDRGLNWNDSGAGLAIGAHGLAGDIEIWSEMQFNLESMMPYIYENGLEKTLEKNLACDLIDIADPTCSLDFTGAELVFEFPFCCADVGSWIGFGTDGFHALELWMLDLATGIPGVTLEQTRLRFSLNTKMLYLGLGFDPGIGFCITPYVTLDLGYVQSPNSMPIIEGFGIDALELDCNIGDVKVIISELLSFDDYYIGIDGAIHNYPDDFSFWTLSNECIQPAYGVHEAISIEIGRDGCCGSDSFVGIYNYFDMTLSDALFDWLGVRVRAEMSFSPSISAYVEAWIWHNEFDAIILGFNYSWGDIRALTEDWNCCWSGVP